MKRFLKKYKLLFLSLLILFAFVGSTYAYLVATDSPVLNSFKLAKVDTKLEEDPGPDGKKVVTIQNKNVSSVYVRARVLVSGADVGVPDNKIVYDGSEPADGISVDWNSTDWIKVGDWFYYQHVLPGHPEGSTDPYPETKPLIYRIVVGSQVDTSHSFEVDVYQESVLTSATDYDQATAEAKFGG